MVISTGNLWVLWFQARFMNRRGSSMVGTNVKLILVADTVLSFNVM